MALQSIRRHYSSHLLARGVHAFLAQLLMDAWRAVGTPALAVDAPDLRTQPLIATGTC